MAEHETSAGHEPSDGLAAMLAELQAENARLDHEIDRQRHASAALRARVEALGPTPSGVSRRRVLKLTGVGLAAGAAMATIPLTKGEAAEAYGAASPTDHLASTGRSPANTPSAKSASANSATGLVYVPAPTGVASTDTPAILNALQAPPGTTVVFVTNGSVSYSINQELPVPAGVRVTGTGPNDEDPLTGLMPTLQQAAGTSLKCIMASAAYLAGLYDTPQYNNGAAATAADAGIEVDHLAFDGQNGGAGAGNSVGHGVVLYSTGSKVHDCYFINVAQAAIVVADTNYAGTAPTAPSTQSGNRVYDNKAANPGTYGIWVTNLAGGSYDGYLLNNILRSPSKQHLATGVGFNVNPATGEPYEALHMDGANGWWVENDHAYACPGGGMYIAGASNLHFVNNSTDDFGCEPVNGSTYVGYDLYMPAVPAPGTTFVNANQLSAYVGYNTDGPAAPNLTNTFLFYRLTVPAGGTGTGVWLEHANNSAHQDSQPPLPISGATVSGTSVTVPADQAVGIVQVGMSITDSAGAIPAGTTVTNVAHTGSTDTITLSTSAGSASSDTVSFPGAPCTAWTYINDDAGTTMHVQRANETVSPTIDPDPSIAGAGSVVLNDPSNYVGGVPVTNGWPLVATAAGPSAGQVIVAQSATSAEWVTLEEAGAGRKAGGVLSGTYPNPTLAAEVTVRMDTSGRYRVPAWATRLRITTVGAGGGGGGGGVAGTRDVQAGGAGGAAGTTSHQFVEVGDNAELEVRIGPGGAGGAGGTRAARAGADGSPGGDTVVEGRGILVRGGGGRGGQGAPGDSATPALGGAFGAADGVSSITTVGCGGASGAPGGGPVSYSAGGGGGGGAAYAGRGGEGGAAGDAAAGGVAGRAGHRSRFRGEPGRSADAPGAGGGGGGGAGQGAAGGTGGSGSAGYAVIEVVA